MFGLFKKKSEVDILQEQYQKLQEESFKLSTIDRAKSDLKAAEAEEIGKKLILWIKAKLVVYRSLESLLL